jgi:pSer/pThr/pTyr-binding forkhead associated (FHA) protein
MAKLYVLNGPAKGRVFTLREGSSFLGRSLDNDVVIEDRTLSRKHLRVVQRANAFFVTDLKSRNGTFYKGDFVKAGVEIQIQEGSPIAVGMTVIGIGEGSEEEMMPLPEITGLVDKALGKTGSFEERRVEASLKTVRFLNKLFDVLKENLPLEESLKRLIDHIFLFLKRIDRAAFVLLDPESKKITGVISKLKKTRNHGKPVFCLDVVKQVIETKRPFAVSNVETEEESSLVDTLKVLKIQSVMCIPLMRRSKVFGVIYVDSLSRPYGFRWDDLLLFSDFSRRLALVLENTLYASQIMAAADALVSEEGED